MSVNDEPAIVSSAENIPLFPRDGERGCSRSFAGRLRSSRDIVVACIACIGAMSMGFALGYSSPALQDPQLAKVLNNAERRSWFGSLVTIGAMIGGPLSAVCVGRLGRKTTLMMCNLPLAVGWFLIVYAADLVLLYCGRLLTGLGVGAISLAVPLYVAEVATSQHRGALGAGFQLLVAFGIFFSYALGSAVNWSWLAVAGAGLSFLHAILLLYVPETTRWQLSRHDHQAALTSLIWLRGTDDIQAEFGEIELAVTNMQMDGSSFGVRDFLQPRIYKPVLVSTMLMVFQQASGVNAVIFYTTQIFADAGYSANPSTPTMIVGAVLFGATILSCIFADLAGRRILLFVSGTLMTVSIVTLGLYFYLTAESHVLGIGWLSLVSLLVYMAFFSIGWGPLPWLVMSEVLPPRAKGLAGGITTSINWLCAFITTKEFEDLEYALHSYGAFWAFGCICFLGIVFVFFFLPETKGKSLEEIESHFAA